MPPEVPKEDEQTNTDRGGASSKRPVMSQGPEHRDQKAFDAARRRLFWSMPSGLYLLGSLDANVRNLMTLNWTTQVSSEPKLIGVSIEREALTHGLVEHSGRFTLSILHRDDRAVVRKFVKPAVDDRDALTLNGVAYRDASGSGLPVLASALGYFDCMVIGSTLFGSHSWFVGEVTDVNVSERLLSDENPEVLSMSDTRMNYGG